MPGDLKPHQCPHCGGRRRVIRTRYDADHVRRRAQCRSCSRRWWTVERVELAPDWKLARRKPSPGERARALQQAMGRVTSSGRPLFLDFGEDQRGYRDRVAVLPAGTEVHSVVQREKP